MFAGTIIILVLYALLPESLRYSRAQILIDTLWGIAALPAVRYVLAKLNLKNFKIGEKENSRFLVIGDLKEANRVAEILKMSALNPEFVGIVSPDENATRKEGFTGNISQVKDIINIYNIDEIIFCSKNISHQNIIDKMTEWHNAKVEYKIAPQDSLSIIGSNSINTRGDLYTVNISRIDKPANIRNKRLIDIVCHSVFDILSRIGFFHKKSFTFSKKHFLGANR